MPAKEPPAPDLVSELAALLSGGAGHDVAAVTPDAPARLTLRQLQDAAKKLGLSAVSKLKKEALAKAVMDGWEALVAGAPSTQPDESQAFVLPQKFEVGESTRGGSEAARQILREASKDIPWGYGRDRVTAMVVDPDRLFIYWETLDESIAKARDQLGLGGAGAWLSIRMYDTTGRIFDGTNAHSTSDHRVERGDRQWFLTVGKPTSELLVEIGMKSHEGYFVKIARSGRVEFPRREPAPAVEPEWLTVRSATGQVERGGSHHPPGRPPRPLAPPPSATLPRQSDPFPAPTGVLRHVPWEDALRFNAIPGERHEWEEVQTDGTVMAHRQVRWESPTTISTWAAGPFPHPVETPDPVRDTTTGKTRVYRTHGRTHVVHGPWQVVIRGLGAQQSRSVLSRWEVYRSWTESAGREGQEWQDWKERPGPMGASERMAGSSERRWAGSSELRFGGASEVFYLHASETRLGGASERAYAGASEWLVRGASERRIGGASERLFLGGSEERLAPPAAGVYPSTSRKGS